MSAKTKPSSVVATIRPDDRYRLLVLLRARARESRFVTRGEVMMQAFTSHHARAVDAQACLDELVRDGLASVTVEPLRVYWYDAARRPIYRATAKLLAMPEPIPPPRMRRKVR